MCWFRWVQKTSWVFHLHRTWSVLLLSLLTTLTPRTASQRDLPASSGGRTSSKAMLTDTSPALRSLSFHPGLYSSETKLGPLLLGEEKTICTTPWHDLAQDVTAPRLPTSLSADRAGSTSRAAHPPLASSPAGKKMPCSQCTSGTSGGQKLQSRQTYCHSPAACGLAHQLRTLRL